MKLMDERIMKYVPASKLVAIDEAFYDSDGYWIFLNYGYTASRTDFHCHVIREDTIADLRYQIAGIKIDESEQDGE